MYRPAIVHSCMLLYLYLYLYSCICLCRYSKLNLILTLTAILMLTRIHVHTHILTSARILMLTRILVPALTSAESRQRWRAAPTRRTFARSTYTRIITLMYSYSYSCSYSYSYSYAYTHAAGGVRLQPSVPLLPRAAPALDPTKARVYRISISICV